MGHHTIEVLIVALSCSVGAAKPASPPPVTPPPAVTLEAKPMPDRVRRYFEFLAREHAALAEQTVAQLAEYEELVSLGERGPVSPKLLSNETLDYERITKKGKQLIVFRTAAKKKLLLSQWNLTVDQCSIRMKSLVNGEVGGRTRNISDLNPPEFVTINPAKADGRVLQVTGPEAMMASPLREDLQGGGYDRFVVEGYPTGTFVDGNVFTLPSDVLFEVDTTSYTTVLGSTSTVPRLRPLREAELAPWKEQERKRRGERYAATVHMPAPGLKK